MLYIILFYIVWLFFSNKLNDKIQYYHHIFTDFHTATKKRF